MTTWTKGRTEAFGHQASQAELWDRPWPVGRAVCPSLDPWAVPAGRQDPGTSRPSPLTRLPPHNALSRQLVPSASQGTIWVTAPPPTPQDGSPSCHQSFLLPPPCTALDFLSLSPPPSPPSSHDSRRSLAPSSHSDLSPGLPCKASLA